MRADGASRDHAHPNRGRMSAHNDLAYLAYVALLAETYMEENDD